MARTREPRNPAVRRCALAAALLWATANVGATEIRVVGSDLLGDAWVRAVGEFARQNDVTVKLNLRGTRPGVDDLVAGRADLGLFLLPPGESPPADAFASRVFAYQVAVVVVPAVSPLQQATAAQLRGLFARSAGGTFSRWGELNLVGEWTSRPVALRALSPQGGLAWPIFQRVTLANGEPQGGVEFWPTPEVFAERLPAAVGAIGITNWFVAGTGMRVLSLAASPTDPAYAPTPENVHRGDYPLRLPLYITFRREAAPELQLFLKFLLSDEAAAALARAHFMTLPTGARNQLVFELEEMK